MSVYDNQAQDAPSGGSGSPDSIPRPPPGQEDKTTLWMGELEPWFDEEAIRKIWAAFGETVTVKLIRDKFSDVNAGYCFVDFGSPAAAQKALTLNGQPIPSSQRVFKLNWASGGGIVDKREDRGPEYSIFVGDLSPDMTEYKLMEIFKSRYPSCKAAKIMTDPVTNMSRGYGFVRFSDESQMQHALVEMQGFYAGNRPLRISTATPKNKNNALYQFQPGAGAVHPPAGGFYGAPPGPFNQYTDPNNTTVFVGGLSSQVNEDELRRYFQGFGDITYVKIPPGKGCGFVQFVQRHSAEAAITQMQGYPIGNSRVRLSWGRSQAAAGAVPGGPYRPGPPPPTVYPQMGIPAQGQYGPYGPVNAREAHMHHHGPEQLVQATGIPVQPGAPVGPGQDPSEPVPVARLNELYLAAKDGRLDRMEVDGRGYHGVYAQ
uniref:ARAD1A08470p n=1 Tax=Blastobotrys adeninivorans TaxID=409370 RepID=A0A060T2H8_BLAAD